MPTLLDRIRHGWNAFQDRDENRKSYVVTDIGSGNMYRPDRPRLRLSTERSMVLSLYNRIAIDVSAIAIQHVRLDQNGRFLEIIDSGLNNCLTLDANIDQTGRAFIQDVVMSMFDEGAVAIVPVDTTINPNISDSYDITTMRTGKITEWFPKYVRLDLYNERTSKKEDIVLPKKKVAVIENPLYSVMNEPNSTLKRLIEKLNILDAIDVQSGSGKLDLIIQLPYVVKTDARREQAEIRRKDLEAQLSGSKYGIAYTDATEKVTQLNRPAENNLMVQIEYLTSMLYGQLGLATSIFDGTADEKTMLNYHNRTVEPVLSAIVDSMRRRFITKTGRTQGQSIKYFKNPFGLISSVDLATIADTLTRNAIITSNEMRDVLGYSPSGDNEADTLRNKNLNPAPVAPSTSVPAPASKPVTVSSSFRFSNQNGSKKSDLKGSVNKVTKGV